MIQKHIFWFISNLLCSADCNRNISMFPKPFDFATLEGFIPSSFGKSGWKVKLVKSFTISKCPFDAATWIVEFPISSVKIPLTDILVKWYLTWVLYNEEGTFKIGVYSSQRPLMEGWHLILKWWHFLFFTLRRDCIWKKSRTLNCLHFQVDLWAK